jgi:hypothetical protein
LGLPAQPCAFSTGLAIALATFVGADLAELGAGHACFPPVITLPRQETGEQDTNIGAIAGDTDGFCILADVCLYKAGMLALLTGAGACQACIDTGLLQFNGHLFGPLPKITCSGMEIRLQTLQKNNTPSMQKATVVRIFARDGPQPAVQLPIISDCDNVTARVFRPSQKFPRGLPGFRLLPNGCAAQLRLTVGLPFLALQH